jgi:hypothetical protein
MSSKIKHPCPNKGQMGKHACNNKSQCWEPCGELGNDERHVRVIPRSTQHDELLKKLKKH